MSERPLIDYVDFGSDGFAGGWEKQARLTRASDSRRAYHVVDAFERELCDYTGAPYAIAVNSCTNALTLSLMYARLKYEKRPFPPIKLPRRTYIGVLQAVLNAGWDVIWSDERWRVDWQERGWYELGPTLVVDAARYLARHAYQGFGEICLSFHSAKQLPLGRGGAILTESESAAEWFLAARMDGRAPGDGGRPVFPALHCPMPPDVAARGLDILSRWNDAGYSPPPLPPTDYPDLSQWWPR